MVTGTQILNLAMGLCDQISDTGDIDNTDYIKQTPSIISILQGEIFKLESPEDVTPIIYTDLADPLAITDKSAITVLPYGLAAQLMVHEDVAKANFFQQRYEELLLKISKKQAGVEVAMTNVYEAVE